MHAAGFSYFENETRRESNLEIDGAVLLNEIEQNIMDDGWTISNYSEQQRKKTSSYLWKALNEKSFVDDWRDIGKCLHVIHVGWLTHIARFRREGWLECRFTAQAFHRVD